MNLRRNNEKRRWQRHPWAVPIRLLTRNTSIEARGLTLSEGGMCVFAVANLGVGTQLEIEFTHPNSRQLVRAHGAIRNRAVYLYGIEFLSKKMGVSKSPTVQNT